MKRKFEQMKINYINVKNIHSGTIKEILYFINASN